MKSAEEKGIEKGATEKAIETAANFLKLGINEEIVANGTRNNSNQKMSCTSFHIFS